MALLNARVVSLLLLLRCSNFTHAEEVRIRALSLSDFQLSTFFVDGWRIYDPSLNISDDYNSTTYFAYPQYGTTFHNSVEINFTGLIISAVDTPQNEEWGVEYLSTGASQQGSEHALLPSTRYSLSAFVGNPKSDNVVCPIVIPFPPFIPVTRQCPRTPGGSDTSDTLDITKHYDLDGFPGYRLEIVAQDPTDNTRIDVLASDDNTLATNLTEEGVFVRALVEFESSPSSVMENEGWFVGVRLVNLNQVDSDNADSDRGIMWKDIRLEYAAVTPAPTPMPTAAPTPTPTAAPTGAPTSMPTGPPSPMPTSAPSASPSPIPTGVPSPMPTGVPTPVPTPMPTGIPSPEPTSIPTFGPTPSPSSEANTVEIGGVPGSGLSTEAIVAISSAAAVAVCFALCVWCCVVAMRSRKALRGAATSNKAIARGDDHQTSGLLDVELGTPQLEGMPPPPYQEPEGLEGQQSGDSDVSSSDVTPPTKRPRANSFDGVPSKGSRRPKSSGARRPRRARDGSRARNLPDAQPSLVLSEQLELSDSESDTDYEWETASDSDSGEHSADRLEQERKGGARPESVKKCEVCGEHVRGHANFTKHMRVLHNKEKMFPCKICGKKFNRRFNMEVHLKTHKTDEHGEPIRPFTCKVCGDSFTQKSNLKRHFTSKHEKPLKCFKCTQRFAKALELDLHYDVAHPGVKKPKIDRKNLELIGTFRCTCQLAFGDFAALEKHMRNCASASGNASPGNAKSPDRRSASGNRSRSTSPEGDDGPDATSLSSIQEVRKHAMMGRVVPAGAMGEPVLKRAHSSLSDLLKAEREYEHKARSESAMLADDDAVPAAVNSDDDAPGECVDIEMSGFKVPSPILDPSAAGSQSAASREHEPLARGLFSHSGKVAATERRGSMPNTAVPRVFFDAPRIVDPAAVSHLDSRSSTPRSSVSMVDAYEHLARQPDAHFSLTEHEGKGAPEEAINQWQAFAQKAPNPSTNASQVQSNEVLSLGGAEGVSAPSLALLASSGGSGMFQTFPSVMSQSSTPAVGGPVQGAHGSLNTEAKIRSTAPADSQSALHDSSGSMSQSILNASTAESNYSMSIADLDIEDPTGTMPNLSTLPLVSGTEGFPAEGFDMSLLGTMSAPDLSTGTGFSSARAPDISTLSSLSQAIDSSQMLDDGATFPSLHATASDSTSSHNPAPLLAYDFTQASTLSQSSPPSTNLSDGSRSVAADFGLHTAEPVPMLEIDPTSSGLVGISSLSSLPDPRLHEVASHSAYQPQALSNVADPSAEASHSPKAIGASAFNPPSTKLHIQATYANQHSGSGQKQSNQSALGDSSSPNIDSQVGSMSVAQGQSHISMDKLSDTPSDQSGSDTLNGSAADGLRVFDIPPSVGNFPDAPFDSSIGLLDSNSRSLSLSHRNSASASFSATGGSLAPGMLASSLSNTFHSNLALLSDEQDRLV